METLEQQEDRLGETAQVMANFRSRLFEPQQEDRGGWMIALAITATVVLAGLGWLAY